MVRYDPGPSVYITKLLDNSFFPKGRNNQSVIIILS